MAYLRDKLRVGGILSGALLLAPALAMGKEGATQEGGISYYQDIRPIFQAECHGCHQPSRDKGGYVMTDFARMLSGGDSADKDKAVIPGKPDDSLLVKLITPKDGEAEMPQKGDPLSETEIKRIRQWVAEGAIDDTPENARRKYDMDNPPVYSHPPYITSIDFSPDGSLIAVSGYHEALIHRADGSGLVARLVGLSARIESVAFSPDGKKLAITGGLPARMGEVQVWDIARQRLLLSKPVTYDTVYGASWSPDGKHIAFGCGDSTVRAIDAKSGEQVLYNAAHNDWPLDTVWSLKGDRIISVGRDMSAKLIEFETQRFIDNLTSITPGALKGGLISIDRHPKFDEVLVGGADGVPQIYRLERIAKRVIGDNSNLVKAFPAMPGRIFAVAYSRDGKRIAAGSSLNGEGRIHVYNSEFDRTVTEEMKKIFGKRVAQRNAEEKKKVDAYQNGGVKVLASEDLEGGVYALAFSPDGKTLAASGADGVLRLMDARTLSLRKAFVPAPLPEDQAGELVAITVSPQRVVIDSQYDYTQLLVHGWLASGETIDLTRKAKFASDSEAIKVDDRGIVRGSKNGKAKLKISHAALTVSASVEARNLDKKYKPDFVRDVMPVVSKLGCNMGTCHGAQDGKNGFKLSLRGYDPIYDVRAFADDLAGRRVNFADPDDSLMLLKATAGVPHEGGQRTKPGTDYYNIVRDWIAEGCQLNTESPRVKSIEVFPKKPVVQKVGGEQQIRVIATYEDGERRDVTAEAFIESGNSDIAKADDQGLVTSLRRGEAPVLARFEGAYDATTLTVMGDRSGFAWEEPPAYNRIDELVAAKWKRMKIRGSGVCTDAGFIRRAYLDLTGLPPSADAVRKFMADKTDSRTKRAALVDELIGNSAYVDHWANKWADLLQVNRKFLGAEGAELFRDWIREQVKRNTPYDKFVRDILAAKGSNKENPAASYYKILRTPEDTMENTTHLFLGTRFNCNKCHDHPFERWTQDQYYELAAYFSRVDLKRDPASGKKNIGGTAVEGAKPLYEIVYDKDAGEVIHDRTKQVTPPKFPYGADFEVKKDATRREKLAAWITSPDNPYFARSYVNRLWGYLLGTGLIEPLDDIRAGNPSSNPELLDYLTEEFIKSGFDARHVIKLICQSRVYQLSVETNQWNEDDEINFSHAKARRLPAEVLFDAIYFATGSTPNFPGVKEGVRAAQLPDVGIKLPDGFLNNLGRPPRESACECERVNDLQLGSIMALVSGPTVDSAISDRENAIAKLVEKEKDDKKVIDELFLRILNRPATENEIKDSLGTMGRLDQDHKQLVADLAAYEKELKPILAQREAEREKRIEEAKGAVAAYEKEIAPREAELDKKQEAAVAKADKALKDYEAKLEEKLAAWEAKPDRSTAWTALDPKTLKAAGGTKLAKEKGGIIFASGPNRKGVYTIVAETDLTGITGIKLEALTDERLPKNGPGRAKDGNFVLTEFEVSHAPQANPKQVKKVALKAAKADFNQDSYNVTTAIDGKAPGANNGWAIAGQQGRDHVATFEAKQAFGSKGGTIITIKLNQNYRSNEHELGKFRISVTTGKPPVDFGVPETIAPVLEVAVAERTDEQKQALMKFFRSVDEDLKKLQRGLAEAKKPRPVDPKLAGLREKLARAEMPLPPDPKLVELKRAVKLGEDQLGNKRLTAAQDIAWALINNPAFLFNH